MRDESEKKSSSSLVEKNFTAHEGTLWKVKFREIENKKTFLLKIYHQLKKNICRIFNLDFKTRTILSFVAAIFNLEYFGNERRRERSLLLPRFFFLCFVILDMYPSQIDLCVLQSMYEK